MQLPFLKKTTPEKNFFLALLVKPYKVGAILFEEINDKLFILATNEVKVGEQVDNLSPEDLLEAADKAISAVEGSLPEGGSVEKTIFSVPYTWIVDGKIDKVPLERLKKICEALGLVPMGYLTTIDAIVSFLAQQEGAPVSAIFVEVAKKSVFVYLVRAGRILEQHSTEVEDKLLETVNALLKKISSVDVLPSKIILLDYEGAVSAQQDFLSHTWPKEIPFLHLPQVMVLEKGFENEATINGVATQMDLEVLSDIKTIEETPSEPALGKAEAADFGFMKEKDVAIEKPPEKVEGLDKSDNLEIPSKKSAKKGEPDVNYFKEENSSEEGREEISETPSRSSSGLAVLSSLPQLSALVRNIRIPELKVLSNFSASPAKLKLVGIIGAVFVVIILVALAYYNVILSAQVNVFLDKRAIDKTADVGFAQNPTTDKTIKISTLTEEVKGDDTKNSTGTKETGDKATGTITIYNKTEDDKNFPKGTILVGPNNLEFDLQDSVSIASTSSFATALSSGKGKVNASKFGKEYNLPSSTNFTVKGFSSSQFIAKNDSALTGGTKKETTVVSDKDLQDLLVSVTDKLSHNAIDQAKQKLASDSDLLPSPLSSDVTDKNYTRKAGDETGSVGISATIKYTLASYSKSDLQKVVDSLSAGQIPDTYSLESNSSKIEISDVNVTRDQTASAKLHVNAIYTPKIDNKKLAAGISGKSENAAIKKIKSITGVTDVVINFKRTIPIFPKLLPLNFHNINIEVKN